MNLKFIISLFVVAGISTLGTSQNCDNFEKKCPDPHKSFKISASSRAFTFKTGSKITVAFNAMGGRDYFISVCGKGRADDVQFKIVAGDIGNAKVLYDNAAVGFAAQKVITMASTQKLFVEISAPKIKLEKGDRECGGIKIAYRETP